MTGKIYFQWQNEALRKTIYPARDMKLRHFLLYYKEIDLWEEYKNKKIEDCSKEKAAYEAAQKKSIEDAFRAEKELRDYFLETAPGGDAPEEKKKKTGGFAMFLKGVQDAITDDGPKEEIQKFEKMLTGLHEAFRTIFPSFENKTDERAQDRKEKIFVAMRIADWEPKYKDLNQRITRRKNVVGATKELGILESAVLGKMKEELDKLKAFVVAQNRLEKRKAEYAEREKKYVKDQAKILVKLEPLQKRIDSLEAQKKTALATIARLSNPPSFDEALKHTSNVTLYDQICEYFTQGIVPAQQPVLATVLETTRGIIDDKGNSFYKDLLQTVQQWNDRGRKDPAWIVGWIQGQTAKFERAQKNLDKEILALEARANAMPAGTARRMNYLMARNILSDAGMRSMIAAEWDRLDDLWAAVSYSVMSPEQRKQELEREQTALQAIEKELQEKTAEALKLKKELEPIDEVLNITRDKYLSEFIPDGEIDVKKHIVPSLAQKYYEELEKKDHDELMEMVFERFYREPERFPLWLQYMVIHFSGMRYASAHGTWADPRDLLLSLQSLELQERYKKTWSSGPDSQGISDEIIAADCDAKIENYSFLKEEEAEPRTAASLPAIIRAALAQSAKPSGEGEAPAPNPVRERICEYYLPRLAPEKSIDTRRKALLDLLIEEESHAIREMKDEEVLERLKDLKDDLKLPDEMWKEIVKLTDLRLTEVTDDKWEKLTAEEQKKWQQANSKYREIMNKWKADNLTGWREEHERANRLIVTQAVCNEVAEHIQHLRGHEGGAGLTQKPLWYTREEKEYYEDKDRQPGPHAYFVRAKSRNDFEVGASILWLRFVHDSPNAWRIARPMTTRAGDGLIDSQYLGRQLDSGGWVYKMGEPVVRTRMKLDSTKKGAKTGPKETQYLRWMHEATVAAVEETAEGTVVLTFETALPYEDPSLSTIGVFKRYVDDLTHDQGEDGYNPAFVGWVPEGTLPAQDLEEMLDWNHILLKERLSHAELEAYREKYIRNRKPPKITIRFLDVEEETAGPVMARKPICEFVQWTDKLASENPDLYKVRIWGDPAEAMRDFDVRIFEDAKFRSNFQAVGTYNKETGRGAVTNFITINRGDIDHLKAMQINDKFEARRVSEKIKNMWLRQKMNWLCKDIGTIFFTKGGKGWETAKTIMWGTVAIGGNLVKVEGEEYFDIKKDGKNVRTRMARLAGFRKYDWGRPLDELLAEGLVHRAFCVMPKNKPWDTPKGIIYSPFFSLLDWDFVGRERPRALYLPFDQLVKPNTTEEIYDGIYQRLKCKPSPPK